MCQVWNRDARVRRRRYQLRAVRPPRKDDESEKLMFRKSRYSAGKRRKNTQSCDTAVANFTPQIRKFENSVAPKKILKSEMKKVPLRILCTFATCPATRGSRSDGQGTILHDSTYYPCPASAVFLLLSDPLRSAYNSPAKASSGKRTSNLRDQGVCCLEPALAGNFRQLTLGCIDAVSLRSNTRWNDEKRK